MLINYKKISKKEKCKILKRKGKKKKLEKKIKEIIY